METSKETNKELAWDPVDPFDKNDLYFWVKIEHLARYIFAADYLKEKAPRSVADIACGIGYGLAELEQVAESVIGVDNSPEVLEIAKRRYSSSKTHFVHCDLDIPDNELVKALGKSSLDSIVCFETLEHLTNPPEALAQFSEVMRPAGVLICSVPNVLFESRDNAGLPINKYHKQFFNYNSFAKLLKQNGFDILYRVGQSWANILFKRERQLLQNEVIKRGLSNTPCIHETDVIRLSAQIIAYPTVEDVEGSYSIIVIACKQQ